MRKSVIAGQAGRVRAWLRGSALLVFGAAILVPSSHAVGADPLPDGYAYEQISPPSTGGQRVQFLAFAPDERSMLTRSAGWYADAPNLPDFGAQYIATRTDTGWVSEAITPPAREVPLVGAFRDVIDWTPDLKRSLWYPSLAENKGTGKYTPVVREADGSLTIAGPTSTGAEGLSEYPMGTSADFRTIVMKTRRRTGILTDGTTDTRSGSRDSFVVARRAQDGTISVEQLGYRNAATMSTSCSLELGGRTARGAVSSDGQKVFFAPAGSGACATATARRVWAKVGSGNPIDLSATACTETCGSAAASHFSGASRDGDRVYFVTAQKLINEDQDTSSRDDLYEYDFRDPTAPLKPVTSSVAAIGAGVVSVVRISEDGAYVYFVANGRALAGANPQGAVPQAGVNNLYVAHRTSGAARASIKFVGALDPADTALIAASGDRPAFPSADGRYLLFTSRADLAGERAVGDVHADAYRYDAVEHTLIRIWTDDPEHNGAARTGGPVLSGPAEAYALQQDWGARRPMSDDGKTIAFGTAERISPFDVNAEEDTYMWREDTGALTMISDGRSVVPSRFQAVSPSGDTVLFTSTEPMVPSHRTDASALFAVRRGGGFPEFPPDVETPCHGEACQGPLNSSNPLLGGAGSQAFSGPGNEQPERDGTPRSVSVERPEKVVGSRARLRVRVPSGGTVSVSGSGLRRTSRRVKASGTVTVVVRLSARGAQTLRRKGRTAILATVRFAPSEGSPSQDTARVSFTKAKARGRSQRIDRGAHRVGGER